MVKLYEYDWRRYKPASADEICKHLNEAGKDGWEAVHIRSVTEILVDRELTIFFKRELDNNKKVIND